MPIELTNAGESSSASPAIDLIERQPPLFAMTSQRAQQVGGVRQANVKGTHMVSTAKLRQVQDDRGMVSLVDRRISGGRGRRQTGRSREAARIYRSPAPLPAQCGYFRFGDRCGLAFIPYSWCRPQGV
jgi:hypothetical protein